MGTPAYMAPEQADGESVDDRCDLFSLGCVLYEFAVGQRPFTGPTTMAVLKAIALKQPPSVLELSRHPPRPGHGDHGPARQEARRPLAFRHGRPRGLRGPGRGSPLRCGLDSRFRHAAFHSRPPEQRRPVVPAAISSSCPASWPGRCPRRLPLDLLLRCRQQGRNRTCQGSFVNENRDSHGHRPRRFRRRGPPGLDRPLFQGPAAELGREIEIGIKTYFSHVNDQGGIAGRKLKLIALDDGYEPGRALDNMKELTQQHKVFAVIGNVGTPTAEKTLPYALEHQMLFFGAFTGALLLRKDPPDRFVFNYRASYEDETVRAIDVLGGIPERRAVDRLGAMQVGLLHFDQEPELRRAPLHGATARGGPHRRSRAPVPLMRRISAMPGTRNSSPTCGFANTLA